MLHTTKRCITQRPLSHQEFDANWQKIEDAINDKEGVVAYNIAHAYTTQVMDADGTTLSVHVSITVQHTMAKLPIIKTWGILNNKLIAADMVNWEAQQANLPLQAGDTLGITIENHVGIHRSTPWPWPITVYVEDEKGNYAEPYTFTPTFD